MSDEYRRVLAAWAAETLPERLGAVKITGVDLDYGEGGAWSTYTVEDPHFDVQINYTIASGQELSWTVVDHDKAAISMSKLLTDLFRIAELP